jgi:hypothetical protein
MILALSAVAVPTAAQTCTATVTLSSDCASEAGVTYIITFVSPVTLLAGNDKLSFDFATGTTFVFADDNDIDVDTIFVLDEDIDVVGANVVILLPVGAGIDAGDTVIVTIRGVKNTAVDGDYELGLDYEFACCGPVDFDCAEYTIIPAIHTLDFILDFSPTYDGMIPGFTPPFKACGQEGYGEDVAFVGWMTVFDLILTADPEGCAPPCEEADMWFVLEECPVDEIVTFYFDTGGVISMYTLDDTDVGDVQVLPDVDLTADPWVDIVWINWIHFSSPGTYKLCFYLECPEVTCGPGAQIVAEVCLDAVVYQWKDAWKIPLYPKWNLISLPLYPFDTDIADVFASLDRIDQLMRVDYFGQCENPADDLGIWHTEVYNATSGNFTPNLMDIEAGKAYWVRMLHPGDAGYDPTFTVLNPASLWVFGNHAPMPPSTSMGYFDVCIGWNMVGFKAPWSGSPLVPISEIVGGAGTGYLWNFNAVLGGVHFGLVYEWDGTIQDWTFGVPPAYLLNPGVGYWIPFDGDGEIYPAP